MEPTRDYQEDKNVQRGIIAVEPFAFFYMLATIAHLSTIPQLTLVKVCNNYFNESVCLNVSRKGFQKEQDIIHKIASLWDIALRCSTLLPALFIVVFVGPITDKIGKRKVLLVQPIIRGLQSLILIINSYFMHLPPGFLLPATIVTGFGGGIQGGQIPSCAYIADVTKRDASRSIRMIVLDGVFFLSAGFGGLLGGFLVQSVGYVYTYVVTLAVCVLNLLYVLLLLPDEREYNTDITKQEDTGDQIAQQNLSTCDKFSNQIVECVSNLRLVFKSISTRCSIIALLILMLLYRLAMLGFEYVIPFYTKHAPFNFSAEKVGIFILVDDLSRGLGSVVVFNIFLRFIRISDYSLLLIGFTMLIALYVAVGSAISATMLYCALILGIGAALPSGIIISIMTKNVPHELHGSSVGLLAISTTTSAIFASILTEGLYSASVDWNPGFVFYVLTSFFVFCILIVIGLMRGCKKEQEDGDEDEITPLQTKEE